MRVDEFIAEECRRQAGLTLRDAPYYTADVMRVAKMAANMGVAWAKARTYFRDLSAHDFVLRVGKFVEPEAAANFRGVGVRIGEWVAPPAERVKELIEEWSFAVEEGRLNPQEAYIAFEKIHPFCDGNGRTGKIIFNWLRGTLENPEFPLNTEGWLIP